MGIGGCIILMAVGAILTFGVDWEISGADLDTIGWILMVVGLIGMLVYMAVLRRRRIITPGAGAVVEQRGTSDERAL
ncbi:DUF6458 family protein [Allostreptomyces psammosilenae]|uniref:Zn-dependent protease with chaperone function n=1 Tax=Allostreptomyces psammosilenae TaxID=1892865 RepID=A0A852ZTX7_9ACTN|nr:DUF6458 family protein [Allostreptomyces psammosilenae]NYI05325.1 Zn-dependent protease with chaperone function [Allostreptomyces psammosilenae]